MRFDILTLFPGMFPPVLSDSIIGRAADQGILQLNYVNIRDYTTDKHGRVDDYPYGGGAGMLMQAEPVVRAFRAVTAGLDHRPLCIYLSPKGRCSVSRPLSGWRQIFPTLFCFAATMKGLTSGRWKKLWITSCRLEIMC